MQDITPAQPTNEAPALKQEQTKTGSENLSLPVLTTDAPTVLADVTPGHRTSEFWLVVVVIVLTAIEGISGVLPAEWAAGLATALAVAWKVARMIYKFNLAQLHVDQVLGVADAEASKQTFITPLLVAALLLPLTLGLSGCAGGGNLPPVTGKICYITKDGQRICVGSDGKQVVVEGEFTQQGFAK